MAAISLKKVTIDEVEMLHELSIKTFIDTYASFNTAADMKLYIQEDLSIETLSREIEDTKTEFYFAILQEQTIGFLKINHRSAKNINPLEKGIEIERIYVLKEFQRMKVGRFLYTCAEEIAKNQGYDYIWLGVWEHNSNARMFYEKIGFIPFGDHIFKLGQDEQRDILMRKDL
jgi:ribosomal protein S18 acetylase RimI-like enzyme